MNKRVSIVVLIIALAILLPARLSAQEEERERKLRLPDKRFGLIVNFTGLAGDLIAEYVDGGQDDPDHAGGLGMKLWLGEKSAVRVLLDFEHQNVSGTTDTWFGVGGAYEYHLLQRRVSPYLGGLAGLEIQTGTDSNFHVYFGAMLGAEFELVENLNLYGEYNLLVSIDEPVFSVDLELGNHAQIGIIVYLN
ncbi:MAG: hypothetical protein JSV89_14765 [Spirochaetaceae bacterium]|nr:MAG: hypothetical protein JSV89_14765 [Spirochaetaceae bacterium]